MGEKVKLKRLINKHRALLGLSTWPIEVIVIDNKIGIVKNKSFEFTNSKKLAEVALRDLNKREFTIYFTRQSLNSEDLESTVLHELLHVLLWKALNISEDCGEAKEERTKNKLYKKLGKEEHFVIDKLLRALL